MTPRELLSLVFQVFRPGNPALKASMLKADEQEARLLRCLQLLDAPVTREIKASTDEAAEF